jgi:hypothetical protein
VLAVHPDPEPAVALGKARELDFEVLVPAIILDRNSQVWFHKTMLAKAKAITIMHAPVHRQSLNNS